MTKQQAPKNSIRKVFDLYQANAIDTDEAVDVCRFSLWQYAKLTNRAPIDVRGSFERMAEQLPAMWGHVEAVEIRSPVGGHRMPDYRLDAAGFMAFLYWKELRGRLPRELSEVAA